MIKAIFEIEGSFKLTDRGLVIYGDITQGTLNEGDFISFNDKAETIKLKIKSIEFLDNIKEKNAKTGLLFYYDSEVQKIHLEELNISKQSAIITIEERRMPYNPKLATRIRKALAHLPNVEEKKMFRGLAFLVDGKMCVNVSGDEMMCRFDPALQETVAEKTGFRTMIMKGKEYKGYGYVSEEGIRLKKEFDFWIGLCLDFNKRAKATVKKKKDY